MKCMKNLAMALKEIDTLTEIINTGRNINNRTATIEIENLRGTT